MEPLELTPLTHLDQWVTWRYEERDGKQAKPPFTATGKPAKVTDPSTWTSYQNVHNCEQSEDFDGIGFVFTDDDPFLMVDLDDCLDEYGFACGAAQGIVEMFDSYTEISPSGRGLRIILKGDWTGPNSIKGTWGGEFAIYATRRYTTITGDTYGSPKPIRENPGALASALRQFNRKAKQKSAPVPDSRTGTGTERIVVDGSLLEDEHPEVRTIISTVWPVGERSTEMQRAVAYMWHEGASADHAYAVCMLNPSFRDKSRGREWWDAYCWRKASNPDFRDKREACKLIRAWIDHVKRFGHKYKDPELRLAHLRATLRHGDIEKADATRAILHSYLPQLSEHAMRTRYTWYLRTDQKHHRTLGVGTTGTMSSYSLLTDASKRILRNWSPDTPVRPSRPSPAEPATHHMSVDRRSTSGPLRDLSVDDPALETLKLWRGLLNVRGEALGRQEWSLAQIAEYEMIDFMPEGTLRPSSWTKAQRRMASNGVLPMRKQAVGSGQTRGYCAVVMDDEDRQYVASTLGTWDYRRERMKPRERKYGCQ